MSKHNGSNVMSATLFAMSFDEAMDEIQRINLVSPGEDENLLMYIKRKEETDVLFCGTNGSLFVVEWTGSHFEILTSIQTIHTCKTAKIF